MNPQDKINGDLRDDHCLGTWCNGLSVPNPDDEPSEPCECNCGHCMRAKGRGEETGPARAADPQDGVVTDRVRYG
jgi:hypothetical protein